MRLINPEDLGAPKGYSNGVLAPVDARLLFVAGQIGWNSAQSLVSDSFIDQFRQALRNVVAVVTAAGGRPQDICRMTLFVTDKSDYLADLPRVGEVYREIMGRHFPAMTLVEVRSLLETGARIEIEATAAIP